MAAGYILGSKDGKFIITPSQDMLIVFTIYQVKLQIVK